MTKYTVRTFICYYKQDVDKFKILVEENNGYWEGYKEINFLNYQNQPVSKQYLCIYQLDQDLSMMVLC